jgi:hypothetical protein
MGYIVLLRVVIIGVSFLLATRAYALEIESFLSLRESKVQVDMDILNLWVDGMIDGVNTTNNALELKGRRKLFCRSNLTRDLAYMIIDSRLKKIKYKSDAHVDIVFIEGLMDIFPCPFP